MYHLILAIFILGIIAAIAGRLGNDKRPGDNPQPPAHHPACCGQHADCEHNKLAATVNRHIAYYDDQELDRFRHTDPATYAEADIQEFREIMHTMRPNEISPWIHSLRLRHINPPDTIRREAIRIIKQEHSPTPA
jgi:hypothetical protein